MKKREGGNGAMGTDGQHGRIGAHPVTEPVKIVFDYGHGQGGMIHRVDQSASLFANGPLLTSNKTAG